MKPRIDDFSTPEEKCAAIWHGKSCSERRFCSVCGKGYRHAPSQPVGNWEEEFDRKFTYKDKKAVYRIYNPRPSIGFPSEDLKAFIKEVAADEYRKGVEHGENNVRFDHAPIFGWLLGESDFPICPDNARYCWRTELRKRLAALSNPTTP